MQWSAITSAGALTWFVAIGGLVGWFLKTRAQSKVKVLPTTKARGVMKPSGELKKHLFASEISIALFNNLPIDVGIHEVILEMQKGKKNFWVEAPVEGSPPESIKAQHSVVILLSTKAVASAQRSFFHDVKTTEGAWYRVVARLGNGQLVKTLWVKIDDPEVREGFNSSSPGAGSGWD